MMTASAAQSGPKDVARERLRVLILSRNFPNSVLPYLGLWVEGLVRGSARLCETKVIAPIPYCPPLPGLDEDFTRFRLVERRRWSEGVEIFHPRFLVPPGTWLHGTEHVPYYLSVVGLVDRLRKDFPFDLIHAHFTYPDGWVAARLGQRYRVPVIITEQAAWRPWMDDYPRVRRRALWAARECSVHIAISRALRDSIVHYTGDLPKLRVIPDGVDGEVFRLAENGARPIPNQILFVGTIRPVKGVDVLLEAVRLLVARGRPVKLVLVGESFYRSYRKEYERLRQMASDLGLSSHVDFAGGKPQAELVRYIQESALLVLPSRRETLGMVLAEALACGTPVVATRCGGPEDIVNEQVGVLVPPEDPEALARGIQEVLDRRGSYDATQLRTYALEKFGLESVGRRLTEVYREAVNRSRSRT